MSVSGSRVRFIHLSVSAAETSFSAPLADNRACALTVNGTNEVIVIERTSRSICHFVKAFDVPLQFNFSIRLPHSLPSWEKCVNSTHSPSLGSLLLSEKCHSWTSTRDLRAQTMKRIGSGTMRPIPISRISHFSYSWSAHWNSVTTTWNIFYLNAKLFHYTSDALAVHCNHIRQQRVAAGTAAQRLNTKHSMALRRLSINKSLEWDINIFSTLLQALSTHTHRMKGENWKRKHCWMTLAHTRSGALNLRTLCFFRIQTERQTY